MEMSIRFPGLGLVFDYVPRSFQIFGMEFTIYGVLIAVGALLGMGLVTLEAKRNGEDQNRYLDMILISCWFQWQVPDYFMWLFHGDFIKKI